MKTWSLKSKIYFVVTLLVLSNFASVTIGIHKLSSLNQSIEEINNVLYKRINILNGVYSNQLNLSIRIRDFMLSANPEERVKISEEMAGKKINLIKGADEFIEMASDKGKVDALKYKEEFNAWYETALQITKLISDQKAQEAFELSATKLSSLRKAMGETLEAIVSLNQERMKAAAENSTVEYENARNQILIISFLLIFFSVALAFYVISKFARDVQHIIENLKENSSQVASASLQIASSSQELSQSSTEQAASLEETASALEQISTMIAKSSESANTTEMSSNESQQRAEEGRKAVGQMMASMDEISQSNQSIMEQVNQSNQEMTEIVRVIQEIGNKTKVINEIVFQTKLLSFNASVEAARAGEHGKGFAVVAEEVGNLAQMSGNAAKEITEMLDTSIVKVERIVKETKSKVENLVDQGKRKVEAGVALAKEGSEVLEEIVKNVSKVTGLSQEISSASKEQAQGVGEINKAMSQLDAVTQQNAAVSEEAASAAEELSAQAESLKAAVETLVVTVQGGILQETEEYEAPKTQVKHFSKEPNIVQLKKASPKKTAPTTHSSLKMAAGDGLRPGRDDEGFK